MAATAFLFLIGLLAILCGIIGIDQAIENPIYFLKSVSYLIPVGTVCTMLHSYLLGKVNEMLVEGICDKLQSKEEYKFVIDRLVHSMIIIKNDQIEYTNDRFLVQF